MLFQVLLFGMKCMHGPLTSVRQGPPRVRLSTDTRWQPASDPVDDRHTTGLGPDDDLQVHTQPHTMSIEGVSS